MAKKFEVRVTDTDNDNDLSTFEYITGEDSTTADDVMEKVHRAINSEHELEFQAGDKFIVIFACSDDEGYYYDVYASREAYEQGNDSYGGQCTGTLSDAIEMALTE